MTQIRLTESITHQRATPTGRRLAFLLLGFKSPLHMNPDVKKKCNTVERSVQPRCFYRWKVKSVDAALGSCGAQLSFLFLLKGPIHPAVCHGGRSDCSRRLLTGRMLLCTAWGWLFVNILLTAPLRRRGCYRTRPHGDASVHLLLTPLTCCSVSICRM